MTTTFLPQGMEPYEYFRQKIESQIQFELQQIEQGIVSPIPTFEIQREVIEPAPGGNGDALLADADALLSDVTYFNTRDFEEFKGEVPSQLLEMMSGNSGEFETF
jgi:hypothetical protein